MKQQNLAVCFFGITRSLSYTINSIEKNVLGPAQKLANLKTYSHFFTQREIDNPRSGEKGNIARDEHLLLNSDWIRLEEPGGCLSKWGFEELKRSGDIWDDEFRSLRNLTHQLHSLDVVTTAALKDGADVCVFCRPDLRYHDSLAQPIGKALGTETDTVFLPKWQSWEGLNDRFSVVVGRTAIAAYGQRIRIAQQYCRDTDGPLHAERLLEYALEQKNIRVEKFDIRASRVRIDGSTSTEDLFRPWIWRFSAAFASKIGIKPFLQRLRDQFR